MNNTSDMIAHCTYCSAEKNPSEIPMAAVNLYKSERIAKVFCEAGRAPFLILSGKFGLLEAHQKISQYDHLLLSSEVNEHIELVSQQLKEKGINKMIFHTASVEKDEKLIPYLECITRSCAKIGVSLEFKESDYLD